MELDLVADVVFVIEATAVNGAYMNELKSNYIVPTIEHFTKGWQVDDGEYLISERHATQYGIVIYRTAANLLDPAVSTYGPFVWPKQVLETIEQLPLVGGGMDSCANMSEGLATAHCCFEDMKERRSRLMIDALNVQRHCILICNSPPYSTPVMECWKHLGKTVEQLAALFHERKINFSIIAPRKMPVLFKLFMKADGDQPVAAKNYAKNIRHLVLLKGYHLKERPPSPNANNVNVGGGGMPNQMVAPVGAGGNPQLQQQQQQQQQQQGGQMQIDNQQGAGQVSQGAQHPVGGMNPGQQQQSQQGPSGPPGLTPQQIMQQQQQQQQQQQFVNQNPNQNPNFQPNVNINPQNRWLFQANQQQQPGQPRPPFMGGSGGLPPGMGPGGPMVGPNQGPMGPGQNPNSALISQLSAPPNQTVNPLLAQQQQQMRIQMLNQHQQQQLQQMQQQQLQQQQNQAQQQQQQQQAMGNVAGGQGPNQNVPGAGPGPGNMQQTVSSSSGGSGGNDPSQHPRDREKIWSGVLEWNEKAKPDQQKVTRTLQCSVATNIKDGEAEIKAENWPSKLLMQLMPKHLVGNIGGQFLKESKMVVFRPTPCEALDTLSKVMATGFAGCVHFTNPIGPGCDIKVLILLYTQEKNAFLGFIPNNQTMFVERLRKVIQQKQMGHGQQQQQQHQQQQQQQQHQQQQQMQNAINHIQNAQMSQQQQQKPTPMEVQHQMEQQQQQQQQQQNYNQYAQQMNMQMGGPGNGPGGPIAQGSGPPPGVIGMQLSDPHHQQQMTLLQQQQQQQQQQQRMPMMGGQNAQMQQVSPHAAAAAAAAAAAMQQQQQQQQQQRMVRPMMSNNPGLRLLLQQQSAPANQFRPQMGGGGGPGGPGGPVGGQMGGGPPNQMGGGPGGGVPMGPNRPYDESNFDFM